MTAQAEQLQKAIGYFELARASGGAGTRHHAGRVAPPVVAEPDDTSFSRC